MAATPPLSPPPSPFDYIRAPDAITRESFARIRNEASLNHLPGLMTVVAERIVHATASVNVADDLRFSDGAPEAARRALERGAPVLVDVEMVARGVTRRFLPKANPVICHLSDADVAVEAKARGETRSAVGVEHWGADLEGAVAVIGNAPTALFRLLEIMLNGGPKPAAILGFPVGFVGAAESKQALAEYANDVPFITLAGRLGGSAVAAAALNAIALGDAQPDGTQTGETP